MRHSLRLSLTAYAALLVAPAATVLPAPTWPAFAVGALVGGTLGALGTTRLDEPNDLLTLPRILLGFALPLGWLWPAFDGASSIPTFLFTPWFGGALAVFPGFVAFAVASEWRTSNRIDGLTERVVFEARKSPESRRQLRIAAGVVLVFAGAATVVSFAVGDDLETTFWMFPALVPIWVAVFAADDDGQEVAIADEGLRVDRQIHDWETLEGYGLTDDALSLSRSGWIHSELSFDRSDIEDVDAVTAALDEHLEREQ